jgi:hypothetical protein
MVIKYLPNLVTDKLPIFCNLNYVYNNTPEY